MLTIGWAIYAGNPTVPMPEALRRRTAGDDVELDIARYVAADEADDADPSCFAPVASTNVHGGNGFRVLTYCCQVFSSNPLKGP